jgi:hypothetical protein
MIILVSHPDLLSRDRSVWRPIYNRLRSIARVKGHNYSTAIPALGYCHFDGNKFKNKAYMAFEFQTPEEYKDFIKRVKQRVRGLQLCLTSTPEWFRDTDDFGVWPGEGHR